MRAIPDATGVRPKGPISRRDGWQKMPFPEIGQNRLIDPSPRRQWLRGDTAWSYVGNLGRFTTNCDSFSYDPTYWPRSQ